MTSATDISINQGSQNSQAMVEKKPSLTQVIENITVDFLKESDKLIQTLGENNDLLARIDNSMFKSQPDLDEPDLTTLKSEPHPIVSLEDKIVALARIMQHQNKRLLDLARKQSNRLSNMAEAVG